MTDLRSACIEAMAETIYETGRTEFIPEPPWSDQVPFVQTEYRNVAAAALDALLGVLEDHADEWLAAEAVRMRAHESILTTKGIASLLAVLREDT